MLMAHAEKSGDVQTGAKEFSEKVTEILQMIASTKESLYA